MVLSGRAVHRSIQGQRHMERGDLVVVHGSWHAWEACRHSNYVGFVLNGTNSHGSPVTSAWTIRSIGCRPSNTGWSRSRIRS